MTYRILIISLLFVVSAFGNPILRLEAPTTVSVGEIWQVSVFADGVGSVLPSQELLAFGFNVGFPHTGLSFSAFAVAPPFLDDTPLLGGPIGGSVFPGLQGQSILLASLSFTALQVGDYVVSVGDQLDRPDITGLFTSEGRHSIAPTYAAVQVKVPEELSTLGCLLIGCGACMLTATLRRRGYCLIALGSK